MKRSRVLSAVVLLCALTLSACGSGGGFAVRVGATEVSHTDLQNEIDGFTERKNFVLELFGFCMTTGEAPDPELAAVTLDPEVLCPAVPLNADGTRLIAPGTTPQGTAAFVLRQRIFFLQVRQALAERGLAPTDAHRAEVNEALAGPSSDGRPYASLLETDDAEADEAFISDLLDDFSSQVALQELVGAEAFAPLIQEANFDVEVHSRYGSWDPDFGQIDPPTGPSPDPEVVSEELFGF